MGGVCAKSEEAADKKLSKYLQKERQVHPLKLLLLGAGMAGKSTIFKQVKRIYNNGFNDAAVRENYKPAIHANVIEGIKVLVHQAQRHGFEFSSERVTAAAAILELQLDTPLTEELGQLIADLWKNEQAIQKIYSLRSTYALGDSVGYMLDNLDRIAKPAYLPTEEDVVRTRVRTSAIVEMAFSLKGVNFLIVDVGGQKGERKKWIHCFEGVQAVLFVAAISEYDQQVPEEPEKNSLLDAIELFANVCNLETFSKTSMILFLNKSDIFAEKFKAHQADLQTIFPEYTGGYDVEQGTNFVMEKFISTRENVDKEIYIHVTCATNQNNVQFVFEAVQDIVIRENLNNCELF
eukprot:c20741_g1_i2.p1 GENE.c20741_g1_i2~~c20741_g1_i2.p1  ORF type:complete len:349 (-),score=132.64 c20741_g1_i2:10-1056(-)